MPATIRTERLVKRFGRVVALDALSLEVSGGVICGLMGPNGSGKSTLLRILAGVARPSHGEVRVLGMPPSPRTAARVAFMPEGDALYGWMSAERAVRLFASFYDDFSTERAHELLDFMALDRTKPYGALSKGMKRRLAAALTFARRADVFLLDEPLSGIDPVSRARIVEVILGGYRTGKSTLLLATHLVSEVECVIEEAVFLLRGKAALVGNADALRAERGTSMSGIFEELTA